MANELYIHYPVAGVTAYAVYRQGPNIVKTDGTIIDLSPSNWPLAAIPIVDSDTQFSYFGNRPSGLPSGQFGVEYYRQLGGSPAITDKFIGADTYYNTGGITALPTPTANSYSSPTDGDAYFSQKMFTTAWGNAITSRKQLALNDATRIINLFNYTGCKTSPTQPFEFPRKGILLQGILLDKDSVPSDILAAQYELALALLKGLDPEKESRGYGVTSRGFASVRTTYDPTRMSEHLKNGVPSALAWAYLYPFFDRLDSDNVSIRRVS